jgi:SAM-dependent methyltransferase
VTALDDPQGVREEYASEERLAARASIYQWSEGPDPLAVLQQAVAEAKPRRCLDVGCGRGQFSEWMAHELGADVVALDQSERMVELTRARGIEAVLGDVRDLPFGDSEFDCVLAAWMLFHVAEVDEALAEIARVLRPGGRLVAVTNGTAHMRELRELLGVATPDWSFSADNGSRLLERHFAHVEARDTSGTVRFPDRDAAQAYVEASVQLAGWSAELPPFDGELAVTRAPCVFVATT